MIYLARKEGRVIFHADRDAMKELDGLEPEKTVSTEEFEEAGGLLRIIAGEIFLGQTEEEKREAAEIRELELEEAELMKELSEKDYKVVKAAEAGLVLSDTDPDLHSRREYCRSRINTIRARLEELTK